MDYEKAYKEALERARTIHNEHHAQCHDVMTKVFPELAESEDERIRKYLMDYVKSAGVGHSLFDSINTKENILLWLEKQGEQKSVNKVEPKAAIENGKWYVCDTTRYTDFEVGKAYYCPKNGMLKPNENETARYVASHCFHLWTNEDAKDGDVLKGYGECYILFKELKDGNLISYCDFSKSKFHSWEEVDWAFQMFDPTTEYQRINFFQKMHEAGYTWDAKTKQLIKIQS